MAHLPRAGTGNSPPRRGFARAGTKGTDKMAKPKLTDREQSHASPSDEAAAEAPNAPMTDDQRTRLRVLSEEAGAPFDEGLTRAEAERHIEALQRRAGLKP